MPLYEYVCEQDGEVIELMRPMANADAPVEDPAGKGRTFTRRFSTFSTGGAATAQDTSLPLGSTCPCGKPGGGCGMMN